MSVDATELNRSAINIDNIALNINFSNSNVFNNYLMFSFKNQGIQIRLLAVP